MADHILNKFTYIFLTNTYVYLRRENLHGKNDFAKVSKN